MLSGGSAHMCLHLKTLSISDRSQGLRNSWLVVTDAEGRVRLPKFPVGGFEVDLVGEGSQFLKSTKGKLHVYCPN